MSEDTVIAEVVGLRSQCVLHDVAALVNQDPNWIPVPTDQDPNWVPIITKQRNSNDG